MKEWIDDWETQNPPFQSYADCAGLGSTSKVLTKGGLMELIATDRSRI